MRQCTSGQQDKGDGSLKTEPLEPVQGKPGAGIDLGEVSFHQKNGMRCVSPESVETITKPMPVSSEVVGDEFTKGTLPFDDCTGGVILQQVVTRLQLPPHRVECHRPGLLPVRGEVRSEYHQVLREGQRLPLSRVYHDGPLGLHRAGGPARPADDE